MALSDKLLLKAVISFGEISIQQKSSEKNWQLPNTY